MKKCIKCHEIKNELEFNEDKQAKDGLHLYCNICHIKYAKEYFFKFGEKSMYKNKKSPAYLGIVVGEWLCKHLFNDVKLMPYGHSGYDFICNKGKKVDVKTAILTSDNYGKNPCWQFGINKNKIADYFIFVAFDNREDLNPMHMWMVSGYELKDKSKISIYSSKKNTDKWQQYEKTIEEVQQCCIALKETDNTNNFIF